VQVGPVPASGFGGRFARGRVGARPAPATDAPTVVKPAWEQSHPRRHRRPEADSNSDSAGRRGLQRADLGERAKAHERHRARGGQNGCRATLDVLRGQFGHGSASASARRGSVGQQLLFPSLVRVGPTRGRCKPRVDSGARDGHDAGVRITRSARKHGVPDADMVHAWENAIRIVEYEYDGEERLMVIGPDRSGRCSSWWWFRSRLPRDSYIATGRGRAGTATSDERRDRWRARMK
jgi:hypothetical protein